MPGAERSIISDAARTRDIHADDLSLVAARRRAPQLSAPAVPPDLERENAYLRRRNAELQDDIIALQSEAGRLRDIVERLHGRKPSGPPDPLSGGQ